MNVDRINSLQPLSRPAGYVYVVRDIEISGAFKIGYTNHPATRFDSFENDLPFRIEPVLILAIHGNAKGIEADLHGRFKSQEKFGEWFRLDDLDLRWICEQYPNWLVFAENVDFRSARALKSAHKITYIPPHNYQNRSKEYSPGYVYVIQDEERTKLFRILWTFDPGKINKFEVLIPFRSKVVIAEQAGREVADELNRRYAQHGRVGNWLDLDDEQIEEIHDSLLPLPATLHKSQPPAKLQARPPVSTPRPASAPTPKPSPAPTSASRQSAIGPLLFIAIVILIGLALVLALANNMFLGLRSQLESPTELPTAASLSADPTHDPVCDTSQYVFGTSDYILCSSVPNNLKPVRRGHCLYEFLDDRDGDGVACESFIAPVSTIESVAGALTVAPDQTDDQECDLSRYVRGVSGYILCNSVPNELKPVRRGHCLYEHLDDRDGDGAVCESFNP